MKWNEAKIRYDKLGLKVVENLKKRQFRPFYVEKKEDVLPLLQTMVEKGEMVANGGSVTLGQCGVMDWLKNGDFDFEEAVYGCEKEFTINNLGLYDNIYIIDMYIPFIIEDVKYNEVYTILIPVNSFVGYEQNDNMQFIYNKDNIKNLKTNDLQYQKFYISKSDMD